MLAHEDDGRVLFVRGAAPAETVDVAISDERPRFANADVVGVVEPGTDRVDVPCPRRLAGCGGCDWMHLDPSRQLALKADVLADALRRIAKRDDVTVELGGSVPTNGYRTSVRAMGDDSGRLGLRSHHSHDVVSIEGCLVAHKAIVELVDTVRVTPGLEVSLRVGASTGLCTALWDPQKGHVENLPAHIATGSDAFVEEEVAGKVLRVSASSFFQSGPDAAQLLVDTVTALVPELAAARSIVDAYGGVGMFARCLAPTSVTKVIIESAAAAVRDAKWNCPEAHVHRGRVEWREAAAYVEAYTDDVDLVVADPARRGLAKAGAAAIAGWSPAVIALVSCDAASFGRDAAMLAEHGYDLAQVVAVDLFPQTHHVECVSRFDRR